MHSTKYTNRLSKEKSPYLLQHACNPVDWYPWGKQAFEKAEVEDKPIFVSIGYSTCHWCHVMRRESFEDDQVAEVLNNNFISIKVDREERPDIDSVYMKYCQAITGKGGWPLNVFITHEKKPFFAGTYFSKKSFMQLLEKIIYIWKNKRCYLIESGDKIFKAVQSQLELYTKSSDIPQSIFDDAYNQLKQLFDYTYGGFGISPKFPAPHNLYFLLRYWKIKGKKQALEMVYKTLDCMYKGGIFDHIGFGFSRYSTDRRWLVPHFEKMLYDNSLLAIAYLETYHATGKSIYADIAKKVLTYMTRDLISPQGAFYSAEDADSEGEEGKFYLFTADEIKNILGQHDGDIFCRYYNITESGNFEGKNIVNLLHTDMDAEIDFDHFQMLRRKVFEYRQRRNPPFKDDKILTGWNALAIAALAIGGRILNDDMYTEYAECALQFILDKLVRDDGRLLARYRDGEASYLAYADDYAYMIWALIELYQTTFKPHYLQRAVQLNEDMIKYFWDNDNGGFFIYAKDSEKLILRPKEFYDGALPSANSVAAVNFARLKNLTASQYIYDFGQKQIDVFAAVANDRPISCTHFLTALLMYKTAEIQVVITGSKQDETVKQMKQVINKIFVPNIAVHIYDETSQDKHILEKLVPYIQGKNALQAKATAYVCKDFSCYAPVRSAEQLEKLLYGLTDKKFMYV